jgi:hypothetical protein
MGHCLLLLNLATPFTILKGLFPIISKNHINDPEPIPGISILIHSDTLSMRVSYGKCHYTSGLYFDDRT